jgi:solute:Na+ symporter, SSS family
MFTWIDWLVIVLYFVMVASIGLYFSRRNANFKDFMFGGGNMPWLAVGIGLIATSVSANTFLGNPADSYANDMRLMMLNIGSLIAIVIVGTIFIPRFRASGIRSAYELLEIKFSRPVRVLAASFYSCHLLFRMGMLIYGPALVLMKITGAPFWMVAISMAVFAMLYTTLGGIKAVTTTDIIQFIIFFGGGLLCIYFISKGVGGFFKTWQLASEAGKTKIFDFSWNPHSDRTFFTASIVYVVFEVAIRGCDQQFVQRYLSTKDTRSANLSSLSSSLLGICVGLLFFTLGTFLYVYFQVAKVEALPNLTKVNEVLPHFIVHVLPTGVKGLLVAAILAADMGALSSVLTALSNTTVVDFLAKAPAGAGEDAHNLRNARKWVILWGILGIMASFVCAIGDVSILQKALFLTSLFTGPLLAIFIQAFFMPWTNPKAVIIGVFFGMLALMPFCNIPLLPPGMWTPMYSLAWQFNPVITVTASIVVSQLVSLLLGGRGRKQPVKFGV